MEETNKRSIWASGVNIIAAIWLIVAPFILGYHMLAVRTNDVIIGIAVGVLALIRVLSYSHRTSWLSSINGILGVWLIIAPFVLSYTMLTDVWNDVIAGVVIAILAFYSASQTAQPEQSHLHVKSHYGDSG